jgi:hypothetical protein
MPANYASPCVLSPNQTGEYDTPNEAVQPKMACRQGSNFREGFSQEMAPSLFAARVAAREFRMTTPHHILSTGGRGSSPGRLVEGATNAAAGSVEHKQLASSNVRIHGLPPAIH